MAGFNIRGIDFVNVEKPTTCDVCGVVCSRKTSMMKQFCKCGCAAATYCCMSCSTIECCKRLPVCKRVQEIKKQPHEKKNDLSNSS